MSFIKSYTTFLPPRYSLAILQQPKKARLCSFKEKVDRRPIDPPPVVQILCDRPDDSLLTDPYFFLYATLSDLSGDSELHFINGNKTTAGAVVQSLHKLKHLDNADGGFFVFSDISVRLEGIYRLKFTLFRMEGESVQALSSILSDPFQVYAPKSFPGMSESTFLTRYFSEQGVRIRIRKEPRRSTLGFSHKRQRSHSVTQEEITAFQDTWNTRPRLTSYFGGLPSPQDLVEHALPHYHRSKSTLQPSLPSPHQLLLKPPIMSVQNILSDKPTHQQLYLVPTLTTEHEKKKNWFSTRKLPLPIIPQENNNRSFF
ncbi:velvet factor-domain-containing protein [Sporodiniella umbellata]|nr:velvet factor-domain-containing protein [Sporodiniella umbellata]